MRGRRIGSARTTFIAAATSLLLVIAGGGAAAAQAGTGKSGGTLGRPADGGDLRTAGAGAQADGTAVAADGRPTAVGRTRAVTLITGDRVELRTGAGIQSVRIVPGPGREGIAFEKRQTEDGRLVVVPSDAMPLLGKGLLDRRLFDVTLLMEDGYHDGARDDVPLIVSYTKGLEARTASRSTLRAAGADRVAMADQDDARRAFAPQLSCKLRHRTAHRPAKLGFVEAEVERRTASL